MGHRDGCVTSTMHCYCTYLLERIPSPSYQMIAQRKPVVNLISPVDPGQCIEKLVSSDYQNF